MNFKDLAVVIPVRMGSSRVKSKVILPFGSRGESLLEWKIKQLRAISPKLKVFVSTESEKLKEISLIAGAEVLDRDYYLADGHKASFSEVITGVIESVPAIHIAWVTVVVPLMSPDEYKDAFSCYYLNVVKKKTHDSLISVNLLKDYLWDEEGAINYSADRNHTISQNLPNIYRVTNGLYMSDKKSIMDRGYLIGKTPLKYEVSKISGIDIDTVEDYKLACNLLPYYLDLGIEL